MKLVTTKEFNRVLETRTEKIYKETNESKRKCYFWAIEQLKKEYEIKDEGLF